MASFPPDGIPWERKMEKLRLAQIVRKTFENLNGTLDWVLMFIVFVPGDGANTQISED